MKELHILDLQPIEFAKQLTTTSSNMIRNIESVELVDASWTKEIQKILPQPIKNEPLTNCLHHCITFTKDFWERVVVVSRMIDVMEELRLMNNFSALLALHCTFQSSQIFRLNETWKVPYILK
uniref:Ras-GEF domain-containing protein n=1 Tax=Amphimedon queenslandica TaxID=400682 RepID=A0A1X7SXQ0_AMPQE